MYNKLFTKILDSSIWLEDTPTRIVWLTFIAAMDEKGFAAFAAIGNVANRARVSLDEAKAAIETLEGPDSESGDPDNEGRRLQRVPGGWMVLNAEKHRDMVTRAIVQEQTRDRVRRFRERLKRNSNAPVTTSEAEAEADTEARSESESKKKLSVEAAVVIPATKPPPATSSATKKPIQPNARSKHPIFRGQRFVVFDWMLEDLSRILGPHYEDFGLDTWFDAVDRLAVAQGVVRAKDAWWPWLQTEVVLEASRRGLTGTPEQDRKAKEATENAEVLRLVHESDARAARGLRQ